jgi:hypothetical protein
MSFNKFHNFSAKKLLFFFFAISSLTIAQKTDVVILQNGDHITGEIKSLEFGILIFKTDDIETINIKWDKIESVQTKNIYEVELVDGRVYYGSIEPGKFEGTLLIKGVTLETRLFMEYMVKITRIKETFWDILSGFVKLGFSYTKASQIGQLSFGFSGKYRTKIFYTELNVNSVITTTNQEPTSRKQDIFLTYNRFLENRWLWAAKLGAEENTELGIRLRMSFGGGGGYNIIQTNRNFLNALVGLSLNREWFIDSTEAKNNLEGLISSSYQLFIYDHPKVSLETALNIFPGLTDFGRVRSNLDINLNWEIFLDFYWVLSFYYNYDNKPTGNASESDYRIESAFKYEL